MRRVTLLVVGAMVLTACSGVPRTSAVHIGTDSSISSGRQVRVIARPPVDGMSPLAVVRGFLDACADPSNDYQVAREYLSGTLASEWDPSAGIRVYDASGLELSQIAKVVVATGRLDSTVSAEGIRSVVLGQPELRVKMTVTSDGNGQWRIAGVPDGILLSRSDVERGYRSLAVYYATPRRDRLVADSMLMPATSSVMATALVRRLLAGPSPLLGDAVASAFPVGTKLTYASVPVKSGVAYVDLSADVLAADQETRRVLAAQLVWTLAQLPEVAAVRISVSGQQLAVPGIGVLSGTKDWAAFNPGQPTARLYVARGPVIQLVSGGKAQTVSRMPQPSAKDLAAVAVNPGNSNLAAVAEGGREVVANLDVKGRLRTVLTGELLTRPTWDAFGNLYAADHGRGVVAVTQTGGALAVTVDKSDLGSGAQVKQLAFSADGIRVAVVLGVGARDILAVGVVTVSKSGARISALHRVEDSIVAVRDLAWGGPLSVTVLGGDGTGGEQILTIGLADGKVVGAQTPVGAQTVAMNAQGDPYVGVVDASSTAVLTERYGQWAVAAQGSGPAFGP